MITRVADLGPGAGRYRLPAWSLRLGRGPGARYLFAGDPDFTRCRTPWRYVEQMGAAHRLESGDVRLTIVAARRGPLTEASLLVERAEGRPHDAASHRT